MFPQNTTKTFITASLVRGSNLEPDVSNDDFLSAYLEYSCWLRMISARQCLSTLENKDSRTLERLAAIASFYQTAGIVVEDALSTYIAWSLWACDKSRFIPDILERISLRLSEPKSTLTLDYVAETRKKYKETNKRIDIYAREYLQLLLQNTDDELPGIFGIEWKKNPSVKLVPRELMPSWSSLGNHIRECIIPLVNPKGALLASCYNKIKHGPQITIMSMMKASTARGLPNEAIVGLDTSETIRLLLNGSRVQETDDEFAQHIRAAPFLLPDAENMKRWFFQQIVHISNSLFIHGTWLYNSNFKDRQRKFRIGRSEIRDIILEQEAHFNATYKFRESSVRELG